MPGKIQSTSKLQSIKDSLPNDSTSDEKKLSLTQKMKLVFPELSKMNKIPMSVKSHYLGTRAQVKAGERELTWTGLTLEELTEMTTRLRERGRQQYQKLKESGGRPFGMGGIIEKEGEVTDESKAPIMRAPAKVKVESNKKRKSTEITETAAAPVAESKTGANLALKRARTKEQQERLRLEERARALRVNAQKLVDSDSDSDSDAEVGESCDDSEDNQSE